MLRSLLPMGAALVVVSALALPAVRAGDTRQPTLQQLKEHVVRLEREAALAQVALAQARARLAQAEGKPEQAALEWRKVVTFYEAEYKAVLARAGTICTPDPFETARGQLAEARAYLAEAETIAPRSWSFCRR